MNILPGGQYNISPDGLVLTIMNVQSNNVGDYCCIAFTNDGDFYSNTSALNICGKCVSSVCLCYVPAHIVFVRLPMQCPSLVFIVVFIVILIVGSPSYFTVVTITYS